MRAFTLCGSAGVDVTVMDYGATITSIAMPDRRGRVDRIVLGYDTLEAYRRGTSYFGAVVGRYANRIARGRFTLDGVTYQLAVNDPPNHLHGGVRGFDKQTWTGAGAPRSVRFELTSPDGGEGYPGTVHAEVTYTLIENELAIVYEATADRATPINLTQHSYFNLTGGRRDILDHELTIAASHYTPVDATQIPTGEIAPVEGTRFDFRKPRRIGGDYDHNFVLDALSGRPALRLDDRGRAREESAETLPVGPPFQARLRDPDSGRTLTMETTEPGVQFYSGVLLEKKNWGVCLETQHFPDSPNQPGFPSTILRPGERYRSETVWRFTIE